MNDEDALQFFLEIKKAVEDVQDDPAYRCMWGCGRRLTVTPTQVTFQDGKWRVTSHTVNPAETKDWARIVERVSMPRNVNERTICPSCRIVVKI